MLLLNLWGSVPPKRSRITTFDTAFDTTFDTAFDTAFDTVKLLLALRTRTHSHTANFQ